MSEQDFINHLRAEKLHAQAARTNFAEKKLVFAGGLLGIGTIGATLNPSGGATSIDLGGLLYLVPVVALAFDLHILAEDYSVKRIGAFLGKNSSDPLEGRWETWVNRHRDFFARWAMTGLTITLAIVAAGVLLASHAAGGGLWASRTARNPLFWVWLIGVFVITVALWLKSKAQRGEILRDEVASQKLSRRVPKELSKLKLAIKTEGNTLNGAAFDQIIDFITKCTAKPRLLRAVQDLAPEHTRAEFLLPVKEDGTPPALDSRQGQRLQSLLAGNPSAKLWLQEGEYGEGQESVLSAARWLCHLAGLRHRVVHLFLDHPTNSDYTLVQVRGLAKAEAPGAFDLPAAGHVIGAESLLDTLYKELHEELGLEQADIAPLREIARYTYPGTPRDDAPFLNVEHRTVYRTRLTEAGLQKIKFADEEAAGIAILPVAQLGALVKSDESRVASGLLHSLEYYLQDEWPEGMAQQGDR